MGWQPPTEDEFNSDWISPLEALDVSDIRMAEDHEIWAITERLRAGQIIAVARTGSMRADLAGVVPFVKIWPGAWRRMTPTDEHYFWRTGDLSVEAAPADYLKGLGHRDRYFNIRFDPASFSANPPPPLALNGPDPTAQEAVDQFPEMDLPQLSKSDAERFCRAILAGWPEAGQDFAHAKAILFFPDRRIPRDWFRRILRSIRGPTKPGKKAQTVD